MIERQTTGYKEVQLGYTIIVRVISGIIYCVTLNVMDAVFKTFLNGEIIPGITKYLCGDSTAMVCVS